MKYVKKKKNGTIARKLLEERKYKFQLEKGKWIGVTDTKGGKAIQSKKARKI